MSATFLIRKTSFGSYFMEEPETLNELQSRKRAKGETNFGRRRLTSIQYTIYCSLLH